MQRRLSTFRTEFIWPVSDTFFKRWWIMPRSCLFLPPTPGLVWMTNMSLYNFHCGGASVLDILHFLSAPKSQKPFLFFPFILLETPIEITKLCKYHFLKLHHSTLKHIAHWPFGWHCSRTDWGEELNLPIGAEDHWLSHYEEHIPWKFHVWKLLRSETVQLIHHTPFIYFSLAFLVMLPVTWKSWCLCNKAKMYDTSRF